MNGEKDRYKGKQAFHKVSLYQFVFQGTAWDRCEPIWNKMKKPLIPTDFHVS